MEDGVGVDVADGVPVAVGVGITVANNLTSSQITLAGEPLVLLTRLTRTRAAAAGAGMLFSAAR
ncbi:MAG: hypothetical protein AAB289_06805 [Chloroflexota bacterium]